MEILVLGAVLALSLISQALVYFYQSSRIEDMEEHFEELNESVDERFQGQLEIINAVHAKVDDVESDIIDKEASELASNIASERIRKGLKEATHYLANSKNPAGAIISPKRELRSAKDMTFNLAKPKKKQARKTR